MIPLLPHFACLLLAASPVSAQAIPLQYPAEPSGLAAMDEGLLVADDELLGVLLFFPWAALEPGAAARPYVVKLERKRADREGPLGKYVPIEDIEGLARGDKNTVYLLCSHEPKGKERRTAREALVKASFTMTPGAEPDFELDVEKGTGLRHDLLERVQGPLRDAGIPVQLDAESLSPALNFEGLGYLRGKLYLGLRAPLHQGKAIIIETSFAGGDERVHLLDLAGGGIRGITATPDGALLLIGVAPGAVPTLWRWSPGGDPVPERALGPEILPQGAVPEGLAPHPAGGYVLAVEQEPHGSGFLLRIP